MLLSTIALLVCSCHALPVTDITLRGFDGYQYQNESGVISVFDDGTGQFIPQGSATDGGGVRFNAPAVLWLLFGLFVGLPLSGTGVRLGRYAAGSGFGLLLTFLAWVGIINTLSTNSISDLAIVLVLFVLFLCGFLVAFFTIEYRSDVFLGLVGGASVALRIMLLKDNLLTPVDVVNWLLIGLFGASGLILSIFWQRLGVIFGTASSGSFLVLLAIDFVVNQQNGISRGLRLLFDRNTAHIADIAVKGYYPPVTSLAWTSVSLALIPFAFGFQYVFWRSMPFWSPETERALSFYANAPLSVDQAVGGGPYIKNHREKPKKERASLGIDLRRGPKVPKPIRLNFGKPSAMMPNKVPKNIRFSF